MSRITTNQIVVSATYNQRITDATNANNVVTDAGLLSHQAVYNSGIGSGTVNEIFHVLSPLASGVVTGFNLTGLQQQLLGYTVTKSFSDVNSITLKNHGTASGANLSFLVNSASGFREPFGYPASGIIVGPMSSLHANRYVSPYVVNSNNRFIQISGIGSGVTFELVVGGHI